MHRQGVAENLGEWDLQTLKASLRAIGLPTKGGTRTLRDRLARSGWLPEVADVGESSVI